MSDADKCLAIAVFLMEEGFRVDDQITAIMQRRFMWYREADQLDMLEVIQWMDRYQYFNELSTVVNNILFETHDPRPSHYALTGLRYGGTL